jgi:hypothetical protein
VRLQVQLEIQHGIAYFLVHTLMISIATNGVGVLGLGSLTPKQELMEVKGTLLGNDHQLQQLEFHLSGVKSHIH